LAATNGVEFSKGQFTGSVVGVAHNLLHLSSGERQSLHNGLSRRRCEAVHRPAAQPTFRDDGHNLRRLSVAAAETGKVPLAGVITFRRSRDRFRTLVALLIFHGPSYELVVPVLGQRIIIHNAESSTDSGVMHIAAGHCVKIGIVEV
jgi:hypothetical protein